MSLVIELKGEKRCKVVETLQEMLQPIASLVGDQDNARKHPPRNLEAIKASLAMRGQHAPVVALEGSRVVRVGNGRLRAAKALGWSHIAVVFVKESDLENRARALADNRASELAEWDGDALVEAMGELHREGLSEGMGFDEEELKQIRGEFSTPPNSEEVFGSVADGLVVMASVSIRCPARLGEQVKARLTSALESVEGQGWTIEQRERQTVRACAEQKRGKRAKDRAEARSEAVS